MDAPQEAVICRRHTLDDGAEVAFVTIDHQRHLNALTGGVIQQLTQCFDDLRDQKSLRLAVLTGAGDKAFVGGADIYEMRHFDAAAARRFIRALHYACRAVRELPVPVLARINGFCLGAGLELAVACDLRVACETAIFGMPEVKLGLPSVIEAALLPDLIGWGRAREILLTGDNFSADRALQMGLVEKVVPVEQLDAAISAWQQSLLANGPNAVRAQKRLIRQWQQLSREDAITAGIEVLADAFADGEAQRRMQDYIQGRQAKRNTS